jgi:transketolase
MHFGIREEAMGAVVNGLAVYQGLRPYGATFMAFSDFLRPAVRLSALMGARAIYIFTHDSVGVGEDGATHQPVEQLAALRIIPRLTVARPADANETAVLWLEAIKLNGPVAFVLSRQDLLVLNPEEYPAVLTGPQKGGYVLSEADGEPEAIVLATGSEVSLALSAQKLLKGQKRVRVVSLPSWEIFERQSQSYKDGVLLPNLDKRLAVEAGLSIGWERYLGPKGQMISVEDFGHSAPAAILFAELGFTPENVAARVLSLFA